MNKKKQVLHANSMQVPAFYLTMRDIVNDVLQFDYNVFSRQLCSLLKMRNW